MKKVSCIVLAIIALSLCLLSCGYDNDDLNLSDTKQASIDPTRKVFEDFNALNAYLKTIPETEYSDEATGFAAGEEDLVKNYVAFLQWVKYSMINTKSK